MDKFIVVLRDPSGDFPPIYLADFGDLGKGTTPNRQEALVCDGDEVDSLVVHAQAMAYMATSAFGLSNKYARQASAEPVVVIGDGQRQEII
jgi:hypothetical protein